jgi:hypothetical protein
MVILSDAGIAVLISIFMLQEQKGPSWQISYSGDEEQVISRMTSRERP